MGVEVYDLLETMNSTSIATLIGVIDATVADLLTWAECCDQTSSAEAQFGLPLHRSGVWALSRREPKQERAQTPHTRSSPTSALLRAEFGLFTAGIRPTSALFVLSSN